MKRGLDLLVSGLLLILLSPLFLVVAILVAFKLGRPVLFAQDRPGRGGRIFRFYKFRTMAPPSPGREDDASRLLPFGEKLRKWSLDELPQLWNVLKGDMSLVGPRPLLPEYLPRYSPRQARRHEVRPGITGWAQVNGRNALSWNERFELDVWYVEHQSFLLDLKILALTARRVIRPKGISAPGSATMPPFEGNPRGGPQ